MERLVPPHRDVSNSLVAFVEDVAGCFNVRGWGTRCLACGKDGASQSGMEEAHMR